MLCTQILLGVCLCANKDKLSLCSDAVVWSWGSSRREAILLLPTYNGHGCLVVTRLYNIPPTIGPELREYSLFSKIMPPAAAATVGSQGTMVWYTTWQQQWLPPIIAKVNAARTPEIYPYILE